ncbi:unnamed protein product [Strongylus vulgaris]|uniref:H/ACA ribonucleoprotein complex subunit n=1 Tax=Strongylus vulgaris TaxID=40348 RepID=A0A3P7IA84_STRVU|nr:unnamed protein product [Strongylus vulgaris]
MSFIVGSSFSLQKYTCENRIKTFKKDHPGGIPEKKKLRTELFDTGDLTNEYDALPPLENLSIHCDESIPLEVVGHVTSVVDCLVVIQSDSGVALDFDSVLFDKDRNSIGVVFDLFGPVKSPFYSVRYNSKEEAAKIEVGMKVYYAPKADQYTKTVIETQVKQIEAEEDVSDDEAVFSDDEKEKQYRARKAAAKVGTTNSISGENSQKRGKRNRVQFSETTSHRGGRGVSYI